jgi:glycosyltransferase involved in cell wall biosynthesis
MGRSIRAVGGATRTEECLVSSASVLISNVGEEVRKKSGSAQAKPFRVLTLTPFFPSAEDPSQGGFIAEPLSMMKSFGISNEILAAQPFYRRARHPEAAAVTWQKYFSIPGNAGLPAAGAFLAARILPAILKTHRETPFDLIHAHAALPCGHAAELISRRLSIPFVVSVHGLDAFFTRQAGVIAGNSCKRVAERVYRSASAVICISEKVRERVIAETQASVTVIHNGVDVQKFFPEKKSTAGLRVLSVGNLIAIKGHALLLRAFAGVLRDAPESSLEIIGDGPERKRLRQLAAKLGIANRVHFSGRRSRDYVARAMRRCAVFALPSSYEGLGCVYLEAMACAKPVIGCRGQGIEEVIEHGKSGMLVTPENEQELTDAMETILRDKELCQRMGKNALAIILDRLTLTHQAQQLAEVYRRCAR